MQERGFEWKMDASRPLFCAPHKPHYSPPSRLFSGVDVSWVGEEPAVLSVKTLKS